MAAVTVRNISDETHRALKLRAMKNGRSTEAEIRHILEKAVLTDNRLKLGSALANIGREFGGIELDFKRDQTATKPADFE